MHATRLHRCSDKTYRQNRITSDHRHLRFQTAISHSRSEVTNVAERLTICVTSMQEFGVNSAGLWEAAHSQCSP